jgi:hypothetical protein
VLYCGHIHVMYALVHTFVFDIWQHVFEFSLWNGQDADNSKWIHAQWINYEINICDGFSMYWPSILQLPFNNLNERVFQMLKCI